jgi:hypothetical protein
MQANVTPLVGMPRLIGFESPASWISRAALSQGVTPRALMLHFGMGANDDVDIHWTESLVRRIHERSHQSPAEFEFSTHMFRQLRRIDPLGETFLLEHKRTSRYRYCPVCLQEQRVKHFMVHWRFHAWMHCPLHNCLMEDKCRHCGENISLVADMINAGRDKKGVPYLDQCMRCTGKLSSHWESVNGKSRQEKFTSPRWMQICNGRALLSALYNNKFNYVDHEPKQHRLRELLILNRKGLLPNKHFLLTWLNAEGVRQK